MRNFSKVTGSLAAITLALGIGSAQAAMVNFTLTGTVVYADGGNLFNLNGGDAVSVVGSFDDDALTGGTGTVLFDAFNTGNTFNVTAGSNYSFTQMNDIDYAVGGFPYLSLTTSTFSGFSFLANIGDFGYFDSDPVFNSGYYFDGDDDNFGTISGTWDSFEMTAVPVPAAAWLFGSGLLGLVGVARRKAA